MIYNIQTLYYSTDIMLKKIKQLIRSKNYEMERNLNRTELKTAKYAAYTIFIR